MDKFYNIDEIEECVNGIIGYYNKMEAELQLVFDEVLPRIKDRATIYAYMVPFNRNEHGLLMFGKSVIAFNANEIRLVLGKERYNKEWPHNLDLFDPTEETYLDKFEELGRKLPKFPYVQRYATFSDIGNEDEIAAAVKKCTAESLITLSDNSIISRWIQYDEIVVLFAIDFENERYLRNKKEIDYVDDENWCYKYFLDTIIKNFLSLWCDNIYFGLTYSTIEFLSAKALIQGSANDILQERGLPEVSVINRLSNTAYEGEFSYGALEFFRDYDEEDMVYLSESVTLDLANIKETRKLLEISKGDICLGVKQDGCRIVGFGKSKDDGSSYHIEFQGKNSWELKKGNVSYIKLEKGQYRLPLDPCRDDVVEQLRSKFKNKVNEKIADIVMAAIDQKHGTIVVVSPIASEETSKLTMAGKGKRLHEVDLTKYIPENHCIITQMCAIDGALMIDPNGKCEGFGLILPNTSGEIGDSTRGARYNSAKAYADSHRDSFVCVVSEDGMVDFF